MNGTQSPRVSEVSHLDVLCYTSKHPFSPLQDLPNVVKPIMESIDGISKSFLTTIDLMKNNKNVESKQIFEKLGSLIDFNQVCLSFFKINYVDLMFFGSYTIV